MVIERIFWDKEEGFQEYLTSAQKLKFKVGKSLSGLLPIVIYLELVHVLFFKNTSPGS